MDFTHATEVLEQWGPWLGLVGLLWRGYHKAKASVTEWADTLLDNHAAHMQASLERIEEQGNAQIELLTRIADK